MVVAREDVRASFCKGVLWLQVGQGAKFRSADLMLRLADMVYETAEEVQATAKSGPRQRCRGRGDLYSRGRWQTRIANVSWW